MNWNTKLKLYHRWLTHQLRSERSRGNQRPSQQNASQRRTQDSIHDEYDQLDKITIEVLRKSGKDARKRQWLWSLSLSLFISFQTINRSMEKRKTQREEIACKGCQKEIAQIPDSLSFHSTPLLSLFSSRGEEEGNRQGIMYKKNKKTKESIEPFLVCLTKNTEGGCERNFQMQREEKRTTENTMHSLFKFASLSFSLTWSLESLSRTNSIRRYTLVCLPFTLLYSFRFLLFLPFLHPQSFEWKFKFKMRDADSFFLARLKDTQRMKTASCEGSQRQEEREKTARIAE